MWRCGKPLSLAVLAWTACAGAGVAQPGRTPPAAVRPQAGTASYFSHEESGKTTASGAPAKPASTMTAASRTLPLGTTAKVVDKDTGKSVDVKVVDRGPYAKHRVIDVSSKAATKLGMKKDGVAHVKVQPLHVPKAAP